MAVATGVTDIRLQLSFLSNRKIKTLRRALGADGVLALIELWCYVAANEPDGLLLGWTQEEIEAVSSWPGDLGVFVVTAVELGLIEQTGAGYAIHDWAENQPYVVGAPARSEAGRAAANARWDKWRKAEAMRDACGSHTDGMPDAYDEHADSNAESENGIAPPSPPTPPPTNPPRKRVPQAEPAGFEVFWKAYPSNKDKKAEARKSWAKLKPDAELQAKILAALSWQRHQPKWTKDNGDYVPMAVTYLNQRRWEDEKTSKADSLDDFFAGAEN